MFTSRVDYVYASDQISFPSREIHHLWENNRPGDLVARITPQINSSNEHMFFFIVLRFWLIFEGSPARILFVYRAFYSLHLLLAVYLL